MVRQRRENIKGLFLGSFTDELNECAYEQLLPHYSGLRGDINLQIPNKEEFHWLTFGHY